MGAQKPMEKPHWRATALAVATAVLLGVSASDASALALGRITVQSALGEPLRAEIDIPEINAEELASLRATIASPEAFRAAGLDYNPALATVSRSPCSAAPTAATSCGCRASAPSTSPSST